MSTSSVVLSSNTINKMEQLRDLVKYQRYGVEYQPIICSHSGEILAYEALARFFTANGEQLSPLIAFDLLHKELPLLRKVELDLKKLQIDYAPENFDLFLNVDPHSMEPASDLHSNPLLEQINRRPNIIVELIENSDIHDARATMLLQNVLKEQGTRTALDDIGANHSLLSLEILSLVDYMKFDRSWLEKLHEQRFVWLFKSMLEFAKLSNKKTILEGIETKEMFSTALSYGIDRVQGFLYRPLFRSVQP